MKHLMLCIAMIAINTMSFSQEYAYLYDSNFGEKHIGSINKDGELAGIKGQFSYYVLKDGRLAGFAFKPKAYLKYNEGAMDRTMHKSDYWMFRFGLEAGLILMWGDIIQNDENTTFFKNKYVMDCTIEEYEPNDEAVFVTIIIGRFDLIQEFLKENN